MPPLATAGFSDLIEWQKNIGDNVLLSQLSIPGTHNSSACYVSLPSVQCQGASVAEQLVHGIRFFDFRVARPFTTKLGNAFGKDNDDLQIIHGKFPVRIPFPVMLEDELNEIYSFLEKHPSECVMVSLKSEGSDKWGEFEFPNLIWEKYIKPHEDRWYLKNKVPRMGEVRGKAFLFRRFGVPQERLVDYGFDAAWWKYNTPQDNRGRIDVQDFNEVNEPADVDKKITYINNHIERAVQYNSTADATQEDTAKLFVNFCSGSNFFNKSCWPYEVSQGVRSKINYSNNAIGMGLIILDYAEVGDWEVPRKLIQLNYEG